jgi:hypothetical protein
MAEDSKDQAEKEVQSIMAEMIELSHAADNGRYDPNVIEKLKLMKSSAMKLASAYGLSHLSNDILTVYKQAVQTEKDDEKEEEKDNIAIRNSLAMTVGKIGTPQEEREPFDFLNLFGDDPKVKQFNEMMSKSNIDSIQSSDDISNLKKHAKHITDQHKDTHVNLKEKTKSLNHQLINEVDPEKRKELLEEIKLHHQAKCEYSCAKKVHKCLSEKEQSPLREIKDKLEDIREHTKQKLDVLNKVHTLIHDKMEELHGGLHGHDKEHARIKIMHGLKHEAKDNPIMQKTLDKLIEKSKASIEGSKSPNTTPHNTQAPSRSVGK